jgi:excisionase family DNA binding protein
MSGDVGVKLSRLLTTREAAEVLGLPIWRVHELALSGRGPAFVRIGRTRRYPTHKLAEWVETNASPEA